MNEKTTFSISAAFLGLVVAALSAESGIGLHVQETWGNVFGGREAVFHISVTLPEQAKGTVSWQFASEGRTIARGEQAIDTTPTKPAVVEIKLAVPPVKEGVIIPASFAVAVTRLGTEKAVTELVKPLWIFPENPFADRTEWLKKLNIRLFDPTGKTAALFTKNAIPFKEVSNVDALPDLKDAVVIVGEDVSFKEHRGLADMLVKAAAAGIPVLCLAPADGEMRMPGSAGDDQPFPSEFDLKQNNVITQLDKRLDSEGWAPDGKIVARRMALQGDRGGVALAVSNDNAGWPWVNLHFAVGKGRLIMCGFAAVSKWADSPTPRFLLVKVLEELEK